MINECIFRELTCGLSDIQYSLSKFELEFTTGKDVNGRLINRILNIEEKIAWTIKIQSSDILKRMLRKFVKK